MHTKPSPGESLEQFHSGKKQKEALCNWEDVEDSLVKIIYTQWMANPQIQMDPLSEHRQQVKTFNYVLTRERGQENQQKIINTNSHVLKGTDISFIQRNRQTIQKGSILPIPANIKFRIAGIVKTNLSKVTSKNAQPTGQFAICAKNRTLHHCLQIRNTAKKVSNTNIKTHQAITQTTGTTKATNSKIHSNNNKLAREEYETYKKHKLKMIHCTKKMKTKQKKLIQRALAT